MTIKEIIKNLNTLATGMIYMSEADSSVKAWSSERKIADELNCASFAGLFGIKLQMVTDRPFGDFIARVCTNYQNIGNEKQAVAWKTLAVWLERDALLSQLSVFRVATGRSKFNYFIVGLSEQQPVGVTFFAVET